MSVYFRFMSLGKLLNYQNCHETKYGSTLNAYESLIGCLCKSWNLKERVTRSSIATPLFATVVETKVWKVCQKERDKDENWDPEVRHSLRSFDTYAWLRDRNWDGVVRREREADARKEWKGYGVGHREALREAGKRKIQRWKRGCSWKEQELNQKSGRSRLDEESERRR